MGALGNFIWGIIKKYWKFLLIALLGVLVFFSVRYNISLREQYLRALNNVDALTFELELSKTKNGEVVATVQELQYTIEEFKQKQKEDAKLIKELGIRANEVREVVKTITETQIVYRDTLVMVQPDSLFNWQQDTKWWSVNQTINVGSNPPQINFDFKCRDSLTHILYKVPKCKFLGIHWGTKCYEIKVVNHNPNSTIEYARWINVSKEKRRRKRDGRD